MTKDNNLSKNEQESLFLISDYSQQIIPVANIGIENANSTAVPILERNLHLQNALQSLIGMSMLRVELNYEGNLPRQLYGIKNESIRQRKTQELASQVKSFDAHFNKAAGLDQLVNAGLTDWQAKRIIAKLKTDFILKYRIPKNAKVAHDYLQKLKTNADALLLLDTDLTASELFTDKGIKDAKEIKFPDKLEKLERFNIVRSDPRAGFLPATNQEKNIVLTFLSYLDDPHYPGGVNDQLMEVFMHQQKIEDKDWRDGVRALESKAYELGDFLENATDSFVSLSDLAGLIADCPNPRVTLAEEIEQGHAGLAAFARYHDLNLYINGKQISKFKRDPTRTKIDRFADSGPGKRKAVEDRYTAKSREEKFSQRIDEFSKTMTIGQSRKLVLEAVQNELTRMNFYINILKQIEYLPGSRFFDQVKRVGQKAVEDSNLLK